jgi:hypothetical protein
MMLRAGREESDGTRLLFAHRLNFAEGEQPRQARLFAPTSPRLRENGGRNGGNHLFRKKAEPAAHAERGVEANPETELIAEEEQGVVRSSPGG